MFVTIFKWLDASPIQPKPDNERRTRPPSSRPQCATPMARDPPTQSFWRLLAALRPPHQRNRRPRTVNCRETRGLGNTLTMIYPRWSTRRAASWLKTIKSQTAISKPRRGNARGKGRCRISTLVRSSYHIIPGTSSDEGHLSHLPRCEPKP